MGFLNIGNKKPSLRTVYAVSTLGVTSDNRTFFDINYFNKLPNQFKSSTKEKFFYDEAAALSFLQRRGTNYGIFTLQLPPKAIITENQQISYIDWEKTNLTAKDFTKIKFHPNAKCEDVLNPSTIPTNPGIRLQSQAIPA